MDVANKERGEQKRMNVATKERQRGRKNLKKKRLDMSRHENARDT